MFYIAGSWMVSTMADIMALFRSTSRWLAVCTWTATSSWGLWRLGLVSESDATYEITASTPLLVLIMPFPFHKANNRRDLHPRNDVEYGSSENEAPSFMSDLQFWREKRRFKPFAFHKET